MANVITITCPGCGQSMKGPADALGKKVRCKSCGQSFVARSSAPAKSADTRAAKAKKPAEVEEIVEVEEVEEALDVLEEIVEVEEVVEEKKPAKAKKPAPKPAAKAPPKPAPAKAESKPTKPGGDEEEEGSNPYGVTELDLAPRCPDCANEMESADAVICLHCGYNTLTRTKYSTKKTIEYTFWDWFFHLGPASACVIGIITLLVFDILYVLKINDWTRGVWDGYLEYFLATGAAKLWLWIISLFVMFFMGRYAFIRFVFHPVPPEKIKKK